MRSFAGQNKKGPDFHLILFLNTGAAGRNRTHDPLVTGNSSAVSAAEIHQLGLSNIPQVIFWRKIMNLHKDSCLVNVHSDRTILATWHDDIS